MKKLRIGINGWSGFIGSNLIKKWEVDKKDIEIVLLPRLFRAEDIEEIQSLDKIIFLSGPSDAEECSKVKETAESMMDNYIFNLLVIKEYNPKVHVVYVSSEAVEDNLTMSNQSSYAIFKIAIERYIVATMNNWTIARIPRVYGKERNKGLMKKIKNGMDLTSHKLISFKDIDRFLVEFSSDVLYLNELEKRNRNFLSYECEHRKNIDGIKKLYGW